MKIVVVSDLHYPNCDLEMLREVVERESPSVPGPPGGCGGLRD